MKESRHIIRASIAGTWLAVLVLCCGDPGYAADLPGKGTQVKLADDGIIEERFQDEIVMKGLERLGYKVAEPIGLASAPAYLAVARGDVDFTPQAWMPQNLDQLEKAGGASKMTRVGVITKNAAQGYMIDKATADKYGIKNIVQLKDPALAKLFDSDGSGKANLAGCPPGWGCDTTIEHQLDAYGLRATVKDNEGEFVPIHADVVARFKNGKPVLFYTYTPMWLSEIIVPGKDAVWLEVPFTALPGGAADDKSTTLPDGRNIGWQTQTIEIVANNDFLAKNPAAKRFLELVKVPVEDVNAENLLIYQGEKNVADVQRHADAWIAQHQSQFDGWIAEATAAAR